jgi:hypothetical protein
MKNISVQADRILGDDSKITHLNDNSISNFNLFQYQEKSCQMDEEKDVQDRSIDMTKKIGH